MLGSATSPISLQPKAGCTLVVIMDIASRRIVGWAMSERIKADLVCQALRMAYWRRKPSAGLIMHTDLVAASTRAIHTAA